MQDRLFRVIVLGGIGLVADACGGKVVVDETAGANAGAGGASSSSVVGAGGAIILTTSSAVGTGGASANAVSSTIAQSSVVGAGGFPQEGPMMQCFPDETAIPCDAGFPQETDSAYPDAGYAEAGFPNETK